MLLACAKESDNQPPLFGEAEAVLNGIEWIGKSNATVYSLDSGRFSIQILEMNEDVIVIFSGVMGMEGHYNIHPDSIGDSIKKVFAVATDQGDAIKGRDRLDTQNSQHIDINVQPVEQQLIKGTFEANFVLTRGDPIFNLQDTLSYSKGKFSAPIWSE